MLRDGDSLSEGKYIHNNRIEITQSIFKRDYDKKVHDTGLKTHFNQDQENPDFGSLKEEMKNEIQNSKETRDKN